MTFEYKVVVIKGDSPIELEQTFSKYGKDGWELCWLQTSVSHRDYSHIVFKRPKVQS